MIYNLSQFNSTSLGEALKLQIRFNELASASACVREVLRIQYGGPILRGRTPSPLLRLLATFTCDNPLDARSLTIHDPRTGQVLMVSFYVSHESVELAVNTR